MSKFIVQISNEITEETTTLDFWFHSEEDAQNYIDNEVYPALGTGEQILGLMGEYYPSEDYDYYVVEVDDDEYLDLKEDPSYGYEPSADMKEKWRMLSLPPVEDDKGNMLACSKCGAGIRWDDGKMVCQNCHKVFNNKTIRKCHKYPYYPD